MALQLVAFGALAGHLHPSGMGTFTFAVSIVLVFQFATSAGFYGVVVREIAQRPEREPSLVTNLFFLRLILGTLGYAGLTGFVALGPFSGAQRGSAAIAGIVLVLFAFDGLRSLLEVRVRMRAVGIGTFLQAAVFTVTVWILARRGASVDSFVWAWVASNAAMLAVIALAAVRIAPLDWRPRPGLWLPLARTAAPFGLSMVMSMAYARFGVILLAALKPSADVGQYGVGAKLLDTLVVIPGVVMAVVTPVLAASYVQPAEVLARRYSRAFQMMALLAFPVAAGGAMTAWRLVPVIPGFGAYGGGGVVASLLSVAAGGVCLAYLTQSVLMIAHRQRRLLTISAIGLAANVALNVILVPAFSYTGAAVAAALTEGTVFALSLVSVRRLVGISPLDGRLARIAVATAAMAVVLVPGYLLPPLAQFAAGVLAYLAALAALRVFTAGEISAAVSGRLRRTGGARAEPLTS
jgi:O-antigen/teichoic acid export membrane protein